MRNVENALWRSTEAGLEAASTEREKSAGRRSESQKCIKWISLWWWFHTYHHHLWFLGGNSSEARKTKKRKASRDNKIKQIKNPFFHGKEFSSCLILFGSSITWGEKIFKVFGFLPAQLKNAWSFKQEAKI